VEAMTREEGKVSGIEKRKIKYLLEKNTSRKNSHAHHNTENLRDSATCLHPPETSRRKLHNNREITMFGLKALSLSPKPMYTQVHSHT
jgi:hypothetical protein